MAGADRVEGLPRPSAAGHNLRSATKKQTASVWRLSAFNVSRAAHPVLLKVRGIVFTIPLTFKKMSMKMKMKVIFYRGILSFSFACQVSVYDKGKGMALLSCHMRKPISHSCIFVFIWKPPGPPALCILSI